MARKVIPGRASASSLKNRAKISVTGAKELKAKIDFFQGPQFAKEVMAQLAPVAIELRDRIRARATAVGAPSVVADSIFAYSDAQKLMANRKRFRLTSIVGVNRGKMGNKYGPSYFEWRTTHGPGRVERKGGGYTIIRKREKGTLLGMSLATIYEFGSSNKVARPYWRPTINAASRHIREGATGAMNRAIEKQKIR